MADTTDIVLSAKQARDIIEVAIEHKVHDGDVPAADKDALDLAGQIVWQAEAGERNGIEHEAIPLVMKIARDRAYFDPGEHGNPTAEEAAEAMRKRTTNGAEPSVSEQPIEPSSPPADDSHLPSQDDLDAQTAENMGRARQARQEAREAVQESDAAVVSAYCRRGQHIKCGGSARVSGVTHVCACECHGQPAPSTPDPEPATVPAQVLAPASTEPVAAVAEESSVEESPRSKAVRQVHADNLPIPPQLDGEPPDLPRDISKLSAVDLRSLHGRYHAALSSCIWKLALEEADQESVKSLMDERISQCMLSLEAIDEKRSVTSIKAEAQDDEKAKQYRKRLSDINAQIRLYKGLKEVYAETCARASREMTFREMELQSAGSPSSGRR